MKTGTLCKKVLLLACVAAGAVAKGAAPTPAVVTLDEVVVTGERERDRQRGRPGTDPQRGYYINVARREFTYFSLTLAGIRQQEVRFRRESAARRLAPQTAQPELPGRAARMSGDRLIAAGEDSLSTVFLILGDHVEETDGLPASIPFGPHTSLVNLDHVRVRVDAGNERIISTIYGIHPQTRRCLGGFSLRDDGQDSPNRFILLSDSYAQCQRAERRREGDLLFSEDVPERLRRAVLEVYDPIASRFSSKLGSEPGQIFVALWEDFPHEGLRFEQSWNRNSLLLFNGSEWQQGLGPQQREALRAEFAAEQIRRRIRQSDWPGAFTESAAIYLLALITAEQAGITSSWLAEALPGWIARCAGHLHERPGPAAAADGVPSVDCGLVVQFVYDAVARAHSGGRSRLYDTWRRLLHAAYRSGESGAKPALVLASSEEARRIVQDVLDGSVKWTRFAEDLDRFGVRMRVTQHAVEPAVSVLSLMNFRD